MKPRDRRRLAYAVALGAFPAATLFTRWHFQAADAPGGAPRGADARS